MMKIHIPGRLYIWWHRAQNRWWDARAQVAGYCNHCPWSPVPGEGGGYNHWRCALDQGHEGLHRARNYVWSEDGRTDYVPVPIGQPMPDQPWERKMAPTRRQQRVRDRWHGEQRAKTRAALAERRAAR